ncbi:MAG: glucuronate isomerase [Clostridia bacterium]|nr:glucuronate isomerase [Clostridia bacterium]
MNKDFMLTSALSCELYREVRDLPIVDYHCHLDAMQILNDEPYENITQMWLYGDHYKWRLMRTAGVAEKYITGDAGDFEKFEKYIQALSYAIGSPLYHWSKMELSKYFGVEEEILPQNAELIYKKANEAIKTKCLSPKRIIAMSNVEAICTIEEIFCDLAAHKALAASRFETKVLPAIRGDKAINIEDENFGAYIQKLSEVTRIRITNLTDLLFALDKQLDAFLNAGCVSADYAFEGLNYEKASSAEVNKIFCDALCGRVHDKDKYITYVLTHMIRGSYKRGFAVQLHAGAKRNNNAAMYKLLGADTGYDSVSDRSYMDGLVKILNDCKNIGKTIIFNLNPADNAMVATTVGCFVDGECAGKVQMGAAWWFNDTFDGMTEMLKATCNLSYLKSFVGMLTDSRSIISYPRHDYFRRILCSFVADFVNRGEFTPNTDILKEIVSSVSYYNAKNYFNI